MTSSISSCTRKIKTSPGLTLPACLVIMDGYGLAEDGPGNAISQADTPCLDTIFSRFSHTSLLASGEAVGLPSGQMGNSEVGHLNIGAGRVVHQELTRITNACRTGALADNEVLKDSFRNAMKPGAVLHLMGLLSDGGVHSSNEHLYALMSLAARMEVPDVLIHCFFDGRDVPPTSGVGYIQELLEVIEKTTTKNTRFVIASISGRYYAMDRDNRWDRVSKAYKAIAEAVPSIPEKSDPIEVVKQSYANGITDEFVVPTSFDPRGVCDGDTVVFFNFRPDRARELTRAFVDPCFDSFDRSRIPHISFVCLTEYDPDIPAPIAFPKEFPDNVLADVLSHAGLRQYHIAETEKYAHVTFFLNGGIEASKDGELRKLIPSPKVSTYDLKPEMSAPEVATTLMQAIDADEADVYIVNFANCDMVGHTGILSAAIEAVEAVDAAVAKVLGAIERRHGIALVTADHGNADKMIADDGSPHTAHTTAPVPLALCNFSNALLSLDGSQGALCDLAPTLLRLIGLTIPSEMTGRSLLC